MKALETLSIEKPPVPLPWTVLSEFVQRILRDFSGGLAIVAWPKEFVVFPQLAGKDASRPSSGRLYDFHQCHVNPKMRQSIAPMSGKSGRSSRRI